MLMPPSFVPQISAAVRISVSLFRVPHAPSRQASSRNTPRRCCLSSRKRKTILPRSRSLLHSFAVRPRFGFHFSAGLVHHRGALVAKRLRAGVPPEAALAGRGRGTGAFADGVVLRVKSVVVGTHAKRGRADDAVHFFVLGGLHRSDGGLGQFVGASIENVRREDGHLGGAGVQANQLVGIATVLDDGAVLLRLE